MEDDQMDSSYDPNLSYEERRRLRKLKRELKLQKNSGYDSSGSSSTSSERSSRYSSPVTHYPLPPTQTRLHKTTPTPARVGDKRATNGRNGDKKTGFGSTNGKSSSSSTSSSLPSSHTILSTTGGHSTATKPRASSDIAQKPSALHYIPPITTTSTTACSCSPHSPHSPIMTEHASMHLSRIIARRKERERSCSSPLSTPTSDLTTPPPGSKVFTFSKIVDVGSASGGQRHRSLSPSTAPFSTTTADFINPISNSQVTSSSEDRAGSRLSTLSSPSSFTIDNLDQLLSPLKPEPSSPPQSFASNLRFVDTNSPVSPSPVYGDEPTTIRGPMQKTNVLYGSHEEGDTSAVTRIPSSGFFDPSQTQSQADVLGLCSPHVSGLGLIEEKKEPESPEKKRGKKTRKSPLRHFRKGSADKVIVEEEEADLTSDRSEAAKKKEGKKASKKRVESAQVGLDEADVHSPEHKTVTSPIRKAFSSRLLPQHPSPSRPMKTSQSFREECHEKSLSPERRRFGSFGSLSPSPGRSREETPESGGSSETGSQDKKRRISLAKRIVNMVVGGGKDSAKSPKPTMANPVVLKNYRVLEEEPSLPDIASFTEVSVDSPSRNGSGPLLGVSHLHDEDDLTSVSAPTLTVVGPSGDFTGGNLRSCSSSASLMLNTVKSADSSSGIKRTSSLTSPSLRARKKVPPGSAGKKKVGGKVSALGSKGVKPVTKTTLKSNPVSPRKTSAAAKSPPRTNPLSPRKSSAVSKLSPNSSPISPRKTSTAAKGSPKSSPVLSHKTTTVARSPSKSSPLSPHKAGTAAKGSPKTSPVAKRRGSSTIDSPNTSPRKVSGLTASRSSPLVSKKVSSSGPPAKTSSAAARTTSLAKTASGQKDSPPMLTRKTTKEGSIVTTSVKFRSSSPTSKKASSASSPKTASGDDTSLKSLSPPQSPSTLGPSPLTKRKVVVKSIKTTPKGSPTSAKKTTPAVKPSKVSSPLVSRSASTRSDVSRTSALSVSSSQPQRGSPKSSPRSSLRQAAPPLLAKVSLGSHSSPSRSTGSGVTPTRNLTGRRPPELSLPVMEDDELAHSPSFSRFSKGRQPIKQMRSADPNKVPSPIPKHSALKPKQSPPEDPYSPGTRRRRIGVSLTESPLPSPSPTAEKRNFDLGASQESKPLETEMDLNTDSLLGSVGQRLSHMVTAQSRAKNHAPSDFMTSSVFDPTSSAEVGAAPRTHPESPSPPEDFLTPEASPVVQRSTKAGDSKAAASRSPAMKRKTSDHSPLHLASRSEVNLSTFTSSRPPKPPSKKLSAPPPMTTKEASGKSVSSTGVNRPRMVMVAGGKAENGVAKNQKTGAAPSGGKALTARSQSSSDIKPPKSPARESSLNRSMKTRSSSRIRPSTAANTGPRRYSVQPAATTSGSTLSRQAPGQASGRKSIRRVSSGDLFAKKIRPGSSSTLTRERKTSTGSSTMTRERKTSGGSSTMPRERKISGGSMTRERKNSGSGGNMAAAAATTKARTGAAGGSGVFASMRRPKSSSSLRPGATATGSSFTKSPATMSMRLPRNSVGQRGSTLRKSSRGAPPLPTVTIDTPVSPSRRGSTLKRMSSTGSLRKQSVAGASGDGDHMMAAFDHISSQASGLLPSSDHRRAVRPKLRQKASASHLKMLHQRKDVSSSIGNNQEEEEIDPNTYSTYMAKKNLAPSAMAGLAANVDFSTVKLRKTGTLQQMLSDQTNSPVDEAAGASPATGNEHNTNHSIVLLQIKGRRNIQTRLVAPCLDSLNSGDVFVALSKDKLFQWVGKSSNIIEKARASDVAMRIIHKKELGCKASSVVVIKEEERAANQNSQRVNKFWDMLGCGTKRTVKSSESVPGDEVHEKAVCLATTVYLLEGDKETAHYVPIHEGSMKMVSVNLLEPKSILLFDFHCEVYVWLGKQCQANLRRKAVELGRQHFDMGCRPPVFNLRNSPARASGRYRPKTSIAGTSKSPRHSVINASGRRMSRVSREVKPRPDWALFGRLTEGSEHILFREKFTDWPEPGRIIKFKDPEKKMKEPTTLQVELQPADVDKMIKESAKFEGLRLEGDNIHRGLGNYKVSKSSFSCNRVRTIDIKKWVIKEFDNVVVPGQQFGVFYTSEAYVVRWGYQISVVRELEGLVPGKGMFARDRAYQKSLQEARNGKCKAEAAASKQAAAAPSKECDDSDASEDEEEGVLESGGRDRCAYFFWQGDDSTVNEKGASALMTMELDKERGPQVRVTQGKEPPAFLALFSGGMVILKGRSETDHLQSQSRKVRIYCVRVQMKNEACLVEVTPTDESISTQLRSRGCYVIQQVRENGLFLWYGSRCTNSLKKSATMAAKMMKNRLNVTDLVRVNEGEEPNNLCCLLGNKKDYIMIDSDARFHQYTPRLFALSSITGEFTASEVLFPARVGDVEAFTFDQSDLYSAIQPAIFLVDSYTELYVWLGWWPREENKLLQEANATTGSSYSHWLRNKKLALETALRYIKACQRTRTPRTYVVVAGTEHERFKNLFPYWEEKPAIQNLNCKGPPVPKRVDVETELAKYSRTEFKLEELKRKPLPEGVDPSKLETYLSDQEFKTVFKVDRAEFAKHPPWKQTKRKKEVGLF